MESEYDRSSLLLLVWSGIVLSGSGSGDVGASETTFSIGGSGDELVVVGGLR